MSAEHLNPSPQDQRENSKRTANIDETYARYERSPFRNYSLRPGQVNHDRINRQKSKNSLMNRFSSVRSKIGSGMQGSNNARSKRSQRPKPDYSLAGPSPYDDDDYDSEEGFGDYGRRPSATIGLGKPFPRQRRGERWRKRDNLKKSKKSESGKPEGQVRFVYSGVSKAHIPGRRRPCWSPRFACPRSPTWRDSRRSSWSWPRP